LSTTNFALDVAAGLPEVIYTSEGNAYLHLPGLIVAESSTGETRYLLSDGLGSVRQAVDETGSVVTYNEFDPYGNPVQNGSSPYGFTGEWWQNEVELLHLRARWYMPETGTFLSRDAFRGIPKLPQSLNGWSYAEGNPVLYADPTGYYNCATSPQQWPKALRGLCLRIQNDLSFRNTFFQEVVFPALVQLNYIDAGILLQNFSLNAGQDMYLGHRVTSSIERAVAKSTKQWARMTYLPRARGNLAVLESKDLPKMRWTSFLSNDKDEMAKGSIPMDKPTWIALGGFQLFINHFGKVERKTDDEYVITLEKRFSMNKGYNFAPNEPGKENNPAEFDLPGLGTVYFPDEWANELDTKGYAEGFTAYGAWTRTEEINVYDPNCDGNWADGFVTHWKVVKHVRPSSLLTSSSASYETVNHWWIDGDLLLGPKNPMEKVTLP
ncbi:MAG: RHS repeat-associated core domain-containing protein, partial [Chloroflexi bacterium]|nr:RHS repeat-associated core domain-containing protein [Chloroflexota bacterium]